MVGAASGGAKLMEALAVPGAALADVLALLSGTDWEPRPHAGADAAGPCRTLACPVLVVRVDRAGGRPTPR